MKKTIIYLSSTLLLFAILIAACSDDSTLDPKAGNLILKLTDAASDDEEIKAIFITISNVKINNKPVRNFEPQTVEISSLKNGKTKVIFNKELPAKQYSQLSLVLNANAIMTDKTPGCYVLTKDNKKHNLLKGNTIEKEIIVTKDFELAPGKETIIIADFDLRKAIIRNESGISRYQFVTDSELGKAIRILHENKTGRIYGTVRSSFPHDNEVYILIYKAGEFVAAEEGTGTGRSNILFANAVTSAKMNTDGEYELSYIEEGNYDIRLAGYKKNYKNEYEFYGFLPTTSRRTGKLLNNIEVLPGSDLEVDIEIFRLF